MENKNTRGHTMKVTFLIGNGFDLNLGLRTLYKHFIVEYKELNGQESEIISEFKKYIKENLDSWANAEKEFGEYTFRYSGEQGREDFLTCHEDFCKELASYLKREEAKLNYESIAKILGKNFATSLKDLTIGFREEPQLKIKESIGKISGGFTYQFISFNYAETLDRCIKAAREISQSLGVRRFSNSNYENSFGTLLHVHGYTDKDMALGVNDETQIKNMKLFENADEEDIAPIIKRLTNKLNKQRMDEKATDLLNSSDLIYIYGMSIGETDRIWWKRICEKMLNGPNLRVIIHQHDAPNETLILRHFKKYERTIKDLFVDGSDVDSSKADALKERIHITRTNLFSNLNGIVNSELNTTKVQQVVPA